MTDLMAEPGIYEDVPELEYHAHPALSQSGMKTLLDCPARYQHERANRVEKDEYDFGHAVHAEILGTGLEIVEVEAADWRSKAAREAKGEAHARGAVPLLAHQVAEVRAIGAAVRDSAAGPILTRPGRSEVSMRWDDPTTGVELRGRIDRVTKLPDGRTVLVDLKTCRTAKPGNRAGSFPYDAHQHGYPLQAATYVNGWHALTGETPAYLIVAVEKTAPYLTVPYLVTDDELDVGHRKMRAALALYTECADTDTWPGYATGIETLTLPTYAYGDTP